MDETEEEEQPRLAKKPHCKSVVWNYFGLESNENDVPIKEKEDKPVCRACNKTVLAKGGNTSNMLTQLRDHHLELYAEAQPMCSQSGSRQPTITEAFDRGKKYDARSPQALELNKCVAYYLAKYMVSLHTVEKPGFRHLVAKLDPKYNLPSRKYFSKQEIPSLFAQVRTDVMKKVSEANYYAATTDLWTSSCNHPYLSYTVHFINNEWKMCSFCLDTVPLFEDHTGQNLAEAFQDILRNWELDSDNLVGITTDNGSNFVSGMELLGWTRVSCFGHNLNLAVNPALKISRVQRVIRKCHSLIEMFNRSWKKNRDLHQRQADFGIK